MLPPNLLYIITDEQRFDTLRCNGNNWLEMPNLNRFADTATVFHEAYCTQPASTPSKGSLMTGLYSHAHGAAQNNVHLRSDAECLPELLPLDRWQSGYFGKWHLGDEIFSQHGFDTWVSTEDAYHQHYSPGRDRTLRSDFSGWLSSIGFKPDREYGRFSRERTGALPERFSKPAFVAERSLEFIRENREAPFIACVNFLEPHHPFIGPRTGAYDPSEIPLPSNFDHPPGSDQPMMYRMLAEQYRRQGYHWYNLETEEGWRQVAAAYAGACTLVDHHIGRILEGLDEMGLTDFTIVVVTSSHGEMLGSHRLLGKSVMYQEAVRVPLLMRLPGQQASNAVTGPFSQIDIVPTVLDCLGVDIPTLHGNSRGDLLGNGGHIKDSAVVIWDGSPTEDEDEDPLEFPGWMQEMAGGVSAILEAQSTPVRTIITPDGWRFSWWADGRHELYDLNTDPGERVNLARHYQHGERVDQCCSDLRIWQVRTGDPRFPAAVAPA